MGIFKRNVFRLEYAIRLGGVEVYGIPEPPPPIAVLRWQRGSKHKGSSHVVTFDPATRSYPFNENLPLMVCSLRTKTTLGVRGDQNADQTSIASTASSSTAALSAATTKLHQKPMSFELHEVDRDGRIKKEIASGKLNLASVVNNQETVLVQMRPSRGPPLLPPLSGFIKVVGGGNTGGPQPILKVGVSSKPAAENPDQQATGSVGGDSDIGSQRSADTTGGDVSDVEEESTAMLSARSIDRSPRIPQQQQPPPQSHSASSSSSSRLHSPRTVPDSAPVSSSSSGSVALLSEISSISDPSRLTTPHQALSAIVDSISFVPANVVAKAVSLPPFPSQQQRPPVQVCSASCQTDEDPLRNDIALLRNRVNEQQTLNMHLRRQIASYAENVHRIIQQDQSPRLKSISVTAANSNPQYDMDADDLEQMSREEKELLSSLSSRLEILKRKERENLELLSRIATAETAFTRSSKTAEEATQKLRDKEKQLVTTQSVLHDLKKQIRNSQRQLDDTRSHLEDLIAERRRDLTRREARKQRYTSSSYHMATSLLWGLLCTVLGVFALPFIVALAPNMLALTSSDDWAAFIFRFALRVFVYTSIYAFFGQRFACAFGFKSFLFELPRLIAGNDVGPLVIPEIKPQSRHATPDSQSSTQTGEHSTLSSPPSATTTTTPAKQESERVVTASTLGEVLLSGLIRGLYLGIALVVMDRLIFTWFLSKYSTVLWKRVTFAFFNGFIEEMRGRMFLLPVVLVATEAVCNWLGIAYRRQRQRQRQQQQQAHLHPPLPSWMEYVFMMLPYLIIAALCSLSFDGMQFHVPAATSTAGGIIAFGIRSFVMQLATTTTFGLMYERSFIFESAIVGHITMSLMVLLFGITTP